MNEAIDYAALGKRIREARKRAGLTQEHLAEASALSAAHIGHIERGTRVPSLETMLKIAVTLHTSIDVLLTDSYGEEDRSLCLPEEIAKNAEKQTLRDLCAHAQTLLQEITNRIAAQPHSCATRPFT